ncbi:MAG: hypothetical protein J5478_05830 [Bacteroidales bacterium]|nr:hypothetical protein [Bacteroidales bacterium]
MKRNYSIIHILVLIIFILMDGWSCSTLEANKDKNQRGEWVYPIYVSLDTDVREKQTIFYIGPEGGTIDLVAYYDFPFTTQTGFVKDKIYDKISLFNDSDNHFDNVSRTEISSLETRYSFTVERNETGRMLGVAVVLIDTVGLAYYESCYGKFIIYQAPE